MSGANASRVRISSCVDCATPIIGERLRCPACHDQHAARLSGVLIGVPVNDDDVTLPRDRQHRTPSVREGVIAWLGACLIVGIVAVLLMTLERSCQ